ncbi:MAG TPA: thiopurine S-methyltransferase [Burkholderiales bacterium]|nr:thiopurine S-methyltransferase [Burkholderiales bacterium]
MKNEFWIERWQRNEIGFHQEEFNPYLRKYWQYARPGCEVFVPLCGKSRDMLWLKDKGHPVLGVELSDIAARSFFEENGLTPEQKRLGNFECFEADRIRILCGDFFDLSSEHLGKTGAVYDRAALVALPREMRKSYVDHLADILLPSTEMLLLTFDYPDHEMQGPPFPVSKEEVRELYGSRFEVELLGEMDTLAENPRFLKRGLTRLSENIFRIVAKD